MRNARSLLLWLLAGAAGLFLLFWAYPRALPLLPQHWSVSQQEAAEIALERLRELGKPVENPYVVVRPDRDVFLERRLQLAVERRGAGALEGLDLAREVLSWEVHVYPRGVQFHEWTYRAYVSVHGQLLGMRLRLDPQAREAPLAQAEARRRADAFLARAGIDLALYEEPEVRSQQLSARTDLTLRYRARANPLVGGATHGVQVFFAGDRFAGFGRWVDDPQEAAVAGSVRGFNFLGFTRVLWIILLATLLAYPFLKRYHEGEIGVRRSIEIFLLVAGAGILMFLVSARADAQDSNFGLVTREQNTWIINLFRIVFYGLPASLLAFFAWSVGESICRERWGHKLAAFDALFQRKLANETVARSAFRGWMAGFALAGGAAALLLVLPAAGGWPFASTMSIATGPLPGLELLLGSLAILLPFYLALILWLLPLGVRRLGTWAGACLATVATAVFLPPMALTLPLVWTYVLSLIVAGVLVTLFLTTDFLTVVLTGFVAQALFMAYPLLTADDMSLQVHGWIVLGVLAVPLLGSIRSLGSGKQFEYSYEDVPPHVRRIAERERQRVELETARRIQSSILPDLPPRLAGVDIAHAYLPASEVGGDFYDVLALEDGRLALAVGDVAGHGVSSGLIMSMAKSALAVQVTFNPEVAEVFRTLNRTVYQTARKRLLATLCYALLDPRRLELVYASAGHLFPYRVTAAGRVESLESVAYPLGVRGDLQVEARNVRLSPGDTLFLFSDGLVEARRDGSDEQFGFERLEASLARHASRGVEALRDGILADVAKFTGNAPREDDQTLLVLRLP